MKTKRILAALLAAIMLTGSLAACADGDGDGETTANPNLPAESETASLISDDLPEDLNYQDDEVTIISRYKEGWTDSEISVEGVTGEPVNDAVFERNKAVEERLGIKIINVQDNTDSAGAVVSKVSVAVKGGTKDYDIMAAACYTTLPETLSGTFINLRREECEYLDLDQAWWIQGFNEAVEYQGVQYAILGSMVLSMYRFGFVTVFNKSIFTNASQPFLYDYVKNGTWTLDKQAELIPLLHKDDGFVSSTYTNIDGYWSACKLDIVKKDEDGNLKMVLDMDRLHGVTEKVLHIFHNTGHAIYKVPGTEDDFIWTTIRQMFADGEAAMASFRVLEMENEVMRGMEQEYGVVPLPKYDETQESYHTLLHDQFTVIAIPSTVTGKRLTEMSAVLEALSSASYSIVKPVYYEDTLRTKIAQDPTAADMMDLITDNVYIDAGILYTGSLGDYHHSLREVIASRSNNAVSLYKARNLACSRSIQQLAGKLDKLLDQP